MDLPVDIIGFSSCTLPPTAAPSSTSHLGWQEKTLAPADGEYHVSGGMSVRCTSRRLLK